MNRFILFIFLFLLNKGMAGPVDLQISGGEPSGEFLVTILFLVIAVFIFCIIVNLFAYSKEKINHLRDKFQKSKDIDTKINKEYKEWEELQENIKAQDQTIHHLTNIGFFPKISERKGHEKIDKFLASIGFWLLGLLAVLFPLWFLLSLYLPSSVKHPIFW